MQPKEEEDRRDHRRHLDGAEAGKQRLASHPGHSHRSPLSLEGTDIGKLGEKSDSSEQSLFSEGITCYQVKHKRTMAGEEHRIFKEDFQRNITRPIYAIWKNQKKRKK